MQLKNNIGIYVLSAVAGVALPLADDAPANITTLILAMISSIAVIVALLTASTAAKRSAFEEQEKLVTRLAADITSLKEEVAGERALRKKLEEDLDKERRRAFRWEDWARRLVRQLKENNLVPVSYEDNTDFPDDEVNAAMLKKETP